MKHNINKNLVQTIQQLYGKASDAMKMVFSLKLLKRQYEQTSAAIPVYLAMAGIIQYF